MKRSELINIPVPAKTESYSPVSNAIILSEIDEALDKAGLVLANENFQTAMNGNIVTGLIDIKSDDDEFQHRLGFQNSYNKKRPFSVVSGTSVFVCTNGMILGDNKFIRKHTGSIVAEMKEQIHASINEFEIMMDSTRVFSAKLKEIDIDPVSVAELCGRMFMEHDIIQSSQLNIIKNELKNPTYEDFADPTVWSLYNHATHALKSTHAYEYNQKHKELQLFFEREFKIVYQ